MVELPKAVWILKIIQLPLAVLILAFQAFDVAIVSNSYSAFAIFAALYTIIILIYYFVAIHGANAIYNWIALLVLECLAVVFWLVQWALLAAGIAFVTWYNTNYTTVYYKRDLAKRYISESTAEAAGDLLYVSLAFGLIEFILFCVTLGLMGAGIHKHRQAGRPMAYDQPGNDTVWGAAPREEKHDMQPTQASAPAGPAEMQGNRYA